LTHSFLPLIGGSDISTKVKAISKTKPYVRIILRSKGNLILEGQAATLDEIGKAFQALPERTLVLAAVEHGGESHPTFGVLLGLINHHGLWVRETRLLDFSDIIDSAGALRK
jgi:hypothetical protein